MPPSNHSKSSPRGPLFIVMNFRSGDTAAQTREATVREILTKAGRPHRLWLVGDASELPGAAREAVEEARGQEGVVVAAGGDGTINTVARAALGSGRPFGVLPQGTFNYFSRTHGIPLDTAEATNLLLEGVVREVQVGMVNDRPFLVNASLGLHTKLLEKREAHKRQFGRTRLVAFFSALLTLMRPPRQMEIILEEGSEKQILRTPTLMVENNQLQLEQVGLPEAHQVAQGHLAAVAVQAQGVLEILCLALYAALGNLGKAGKVISFPFHTLTVQPLRRRSLKVSTDGEVIWLPPPLVFRVAPHPLLLIVPAEPETSPLDGIAI